MEKNIEKEMETGSKQGSYCVLQALQVVDVFGKSG